MTAFLSKQFAMPTDPLTDPLQGSTPPPEGGTKNQIVDIFDPNEELLTPSPVPLPMPIAPEPDASASSFISDSVLSDFGFADDPDEAEEPDAPR